MTATPGPGRDDLDKLERKHAENPEGRYFVPLANAYRRAGEVERAIALLRTGLEAHPDYLSARVVLGRCLLDAGRDGEAADEFSYVLSLEPQNLIALRALGDLALAAGETEVGRARYQALLAADPLNPEARAALDAIASELDAPEAPLEAELDEPSYDAQPLDGPDIAPGEIAPAAPESEDDDLDALFGTMINLDEGPGSREPGDGDAVVTETIAELYTRQGFYDRAAGVYRELIRRRGAEERLVRALERVEALARVGDEDEGEGEGTAGESGGATAQGARSQEPQQETEPETEQEPQEGSEGAGAAAAVAANDEAELPREGGAETDAQVAWADREAGEARLATGDEAPVEADPFADSFADGFPTLEDAGREEGAGAAAGSESGIGAEGAEEDPASESPSTIRDLLVSVIGWTPVGARAPESEVALEATGAPEGAEAVQAEEAAEAGQLGEKQQNRAAGEVAVLETAMGGADDAGTAGPATGQTAGAGSAPDDDVLFPWELPPASEEASAAADVDAAELRAAEVAEHEAMPSGEPVAPADTGGASEQADPEGAGPPAPDEVPTPVKDVPVPEETSSPEEEDDDDLESFQEWLRSLRR